MKISNKISAAIIVLFAVLWLGMRFGYLPNYRERAANLALIALNRAMNDPAVAPRQNADGTTDYALISHPFLGYPGKAWVLRLPSNAYVYRSEDAMGDEVQRIARGAKYAGNFTPNEFINVWLTLPGLEPETAEQHDAAPYSNQNIQLRIQNALSLMENRNEENPAYEACRVVRQVAPGVAELKPGLPPEAQEGIDKGCYVPNGPKQRFTGYRITEDNGDFIIALNCLNEPDKPDEAGCSGELDLDNIRAIGVHLPIRRIAPEELRNLMKSIIAFIKKANVQTVTFKKGESFKFSN